MQPAKADCGLAKPQARSLAGCRLLALTRYTVAGASSRQRFFQFVPALEHAGVDVTTAPFFDDCYIDAFNASRGKVRRGVLRAYIRRVQMVARSQAYDLIWIEKEIFPFLPGPLERVVGRKNQSYVVDYDDAVFHSYDLHRSLLVRRLLSRKLDRLLSGAALVTVGNSYLANYATTHGARVVMQIPTVVDPSRYVGAQVVSRAETRIVWIGSPSTAAYLRQVTPVLASLSQNRSLCLVVIGAVIPPVSGLRIEHHDWSEDTEAALLAGCDIGIMPLPDQPWERGKCGYKLIQYMAAGLPAVASPVGVNSEIVTAETGLLATTPNEWQAALRTLIESPVRRHAMGTRGREIVEERFSTTYVSALMTDALASLYRAGTGHT